MAAVKQTSMNRTEEKSPARKLFRTFSSCAVCVIARFCSFAMGESYSDAWRRKVSKGL